MMLLETGMKEEVGAADEKGNTPKSFSFSFFLMSENVIGGLFGTVFRHVTVPVKLWPAQSGNICGSLVVCVRVCASASVIHLLVPYYAL